MRGSVPVSSSEGWCRRVLWHCSGALGGRSLWEGGSRAGREESPPPLLREGRSHSGRSVVSPVGRVVLRRGLLGGQGRGLLAARREIGRATWRAGRSHA